MKKPNNRKTVLIDKRFQLRLAFMNLGLMLVVQAIMFFSLRLFFDKSHQAGVKANLPIEHDYFAFISGQESFMIQLFIIAAALSFVGAFLANILFSFKVVGPIFRLKKFFADLGAGKKTGKIQFRKGDYLNELADDINKSLKL